MYVLPKLNYSLASFARSLDCCWIGAIPIIPKPFCKKWNCHNNTIEYVSWYGGQRILGYYLLENKLEKKYIAILHSIVKTFDNKLIDITPFDDERKYNMFCISKNQVPDYSLQEISATIENSFKGLSL